MLNFIKITHTFKEFAHYKIFKLRKEKNISFLLSYLCAKKKKIVKQINSFKSDIYLI